MSVALESTLADVVRYGLVYLQCGDLYDPIAVRSQLKEAALERGWSFEGFGVTEQPGTLPLAGPAAITVVDGFEEVVDTPGMCEQLSRLRSLVQRALEDGNRILLLSRVPRLRLQGCVGSQLIIDAKPSFLIPLEPAAVVTLAERSGIPSRRRDGLYSATAGLPGLMGRLFDLAGEEGFSLDRAAAALDDSAYRALAEVGPEVVAWLDAASELAVERVDHTDMPALVLEALRGSGVAASADGWRTVDLFSGRLGLHVRRAVQRYSEGSTQLPAQFLEAVTDVWRIERMLRGSVGSAARAKFGKDWKRHVFASPEHDARALGRAQQEAFPRASSVRDLPSPVEWATLGELLDLIESEPWSRPFGIPLSQWRSFKQDILPIRDRIAHMRLLRPGDADRIRTWRYRIDRWATEAQDA